MRSWCFDSEPIETGEGVTYDREYGSADIREVVGKLVGNGVYAEPATNMMVVANGGLTAAILSGYCWIKGALGVIDENETVSVTFDSSSNGRVDVVVARFDLALAYRSIRIEVIKGAEGSSVVPPLIRNDSTYDIQLARVNVRPSATSIWQSDITDTRYDKNVCGIVTGVIDQLDISGALAQSKAQFDEFMADLEANLTGDVAGNLLTLINNHKADTEVHLTSNPLPIARGGTGAATAKAARENVCCKIYNYTNIGTVTTITISNPTPSLIMVIPTKSALVDGDMVITGALNTTTTNTVTIFKRTTSEVTATYDILEGHLKITKPSAVTGLSVTVMLYY